MISYEDAGRLIQSWNRVERTIINEDGRNIIEKIKSYGKRNDDLFKSVNKGNLNSILSKYCIYSSKDRRVISYIRKSYEILNKNQFNDCVSCPTQAKCPTNNPEIWNEFTSCLLIAYQIRNNIAHLGKLDNTYRNREFYNFAQQIFNLIK